MGCGYFAADDSVVGLRPISADSRLGYLSAARVCFPDGRRHEVAEQTDRRAGIRECGSRAVVPLCRSFHGLAQFPYGSGYHAGARGSNCLAPPLMILKSVKEKAFRARTSWRNKALLQHSGRGHVSFIARAGEITGYLGPNGFRQVNQMLTYLTAQGLSDAQLQLISGHASKKFISTCH